MPVYTHTHTHTHIDIKGGLSTFPFSSSRESSLFFWVDFFIYFCLISEYMHMLRLSSVSHIDLHIHITAEVKPPSLSSCVYIEFKGLVMNNRRSYLCLKFTANYPKHKDKYSPFVSLTSTTHELINHST